MPDSSDPRLLAASCIDLQPVSTVHVNPWFRVLDRGSYFTTEYTEAQAVVVPMVDNRAVVLAKVKRPVLADVTWELPAGGLKLEQETAAEGAARELHEETGLAIPVERFMPQPPLAAAPNRNPRLTYIFRVNLSSDEFSQRHAHDAEVQEVRAFSLVEAREMILSGVIYVTMPVALIGRMLLDRTLT